MAIYKNGIKIDRVYKTSTRIDRIYKGSQLVFQNDAVITFYDLTVSGGTGTGKYESGQTVNIVADAAASGYTFSTWTGDTQYVTSLTSSATTVTMPATGVTIGSSYEDTIDWTYEGVMTVGFISEPAPLYGYVLDITGSMNPTLNDVFAIDWEGSWFSVISYIDLGDTMIAEINTLVYIFTKEFIANRYFYRQYMEENPFPAVGEYCDIKLKYTIPQPAEWNY